MSDFEKVVVRLLLCILRRMKIRPAFYNELEPEETSVTTEARRLIQ